MTKRRTTKRDAIDQAVEAFVCDLSGPVALSDAVPRVRRCLKSYKNASNDSLLDGIIESPLLTWHPDQERVIPRSLVYGGARLVIQPLPLELQMGILVPGHRPYPYCLSELLPRQVTFLTPDGVPIPLRKVRLPLRDAGIYHSLLLPETLMAVLADANPGREHLADSPTSTQELEFSVFDFSSVYRQLDLKLGQALVATVQDWTKGVFKLESDPFIPADTGRAADWLRNMDRSVATAFGVLRSLTAPAVAVFAWALELGPPSLLAEPPMGLGTYLAKSGTTRLTNQGVLSFVLSDTAGLDDDDDFEDLDFEDDDFDDLDPNDDFDAFGGEVDAEMSRLLKLIEQHCGSTTRPPIEEAAIRLGIFYTADEIDAIMRDQLSRGDRDIRNLKTRLAPGEIRDDEDSPDFGDLLSVRWKAVKREYSPGGEPDLKKELRRRLIEASDARVVLLQQIQRLGLGPQDLPEEEMAHLSVASEHLRRSLTVLEEADGLQLPVMAGSVTNIHAAILRLAANIVDAFREQWRLV